MIRGSGSTTMQVDGPTVRVRLDMAYDGERFAGWARQPGQRTVQGVLESALAESFRREIALPAVSTVCAGRTDAGVHARGQVAHVDLPKAAWEARGGPRLVGHINAFLDADVRVRRVAEAPAGFDARFSALSRAYAYRVSDDPQGLDPILRGFVVHRKRPLDLAQMSMAARSLIGEHDFAAFCRARAGASTVRRVLRLECERDGSQLAVVTIESDAFCHSMVRAIVGALLAVGEHRRDAAWPGRVLAGGVRDPAVTVAPAHGLVLEHVTYPPDALLGERAAATRRVRGPVH
ncbi:MAG: tRNA pseudouridine(38-40) synthase TruA [Candidatus Nanopelagicales bacterium]|nr:tRNA pseudouridine(38-40) synthase TruA [Candidatus Nanopelagicales bacterium]MDZ4248555.1 tRNA pseudouridine(38-40) synthase TruA [Candidatus Nanopelagicales bacterium]